MGPVKASPEAQLRLLELADLDAELGRLGQRRRTLPEAAQLEQISARMGELRDGVVMADTELSDLAREQTRAERDVEQVRSRIDRDRARLDGGQVSAARELENLQSEVQSLLRRQSDLEEIVLDAMERREAAEGRRDALATEQADPHRAGRGADRQTGRRAGRDRRAGGPRPKARRTTVAADVPADVLTLYDKLRAQQGVGAAMLRRGRCEGCHLALHTVDLNQIRARRARRGGPLRGMPPNPRPYRRFGPVTRPAVRRLIVEADGGSRGNPGPAGYGALVRDADTGRSWPSGRESIGIATNNVAEYSGLIAGLRAAARRSTRAPPSRSGWIPSSSWSRCPAAGRSSTRT